MSNPTEAETDAIIAGQQARAELPVMSQAYDSLQQELMAAWLTSDPASGTAERERIHAVMKVMWRVKASVEAIIAGGDAAAEAARLRDEPPPERGVV